MVPGSGRSPGEGIGYSHQYFGLENSMGCIVHGVTKSRTQLGNSHSLYWCTDRYFFFLVVCVYSVDSAMSDPFQPHALYPTRLLCPWDFLNKNTRVGCHALLQGTFLTQRSNPGLLHCRQILYHLSHQGTQRQWKSDKSIYPTS